MSMPTVWMNVTTSETWKRPPVGVVRCEIEVARGLEQLLPAGQFKKCVWAGDRFVELGTETQAVAEKKVEAAVPVQMPRQEEMLFPVIPRKQSLKNIAQAVVSIAPSCMRPLLDNVLRWIKPPVKKVFLQLQALKWKWKTKRAKADDTLADQLVERKIEKSAKTQDASNQGRFTIFHEGDIFISIGGDWDHAYVSDYIEMKHFGLKIITCCYDIIPILFPQYCIEHVAKKFASYFIDLAEPSDEIICISKQSRNDLHKFLYDVGARIPHMDVVRLGDNVVESNGAVGSEVKDVASQKFILYVSSIEGRKNHQVLYQAYHILCEQGKSDAIPCLVFVGMPGWAVGDLMHDISMDPYTKDKIFLLNRVSDSELSYLYDRALFCLYPSFYEGWGLPVAEALALGKFVLSSDRGSLPEVGGDLVEYIPAWNPYLWAEKILQYATDDDLLKQKEARIKKEYKKAEWIDTAREVKSVIDRISKE